MNRPQFDTPEELEDHLKSQLGIERGQLFFRLRMELNHAYDKWVVLKDFTEYATVLTLSSALPFFQLTETTYFTSLLIDITRLTDVSKGGKNDTICSLHRHLNEPERSIVRKWAKVARKKANPFWELRNKKIAHLDNAVATGKRSLRYTKVDILDIRETLDSIAETLEVFYFVILKPESPKSVIRTRGWHTSNIEGSVGQLNYLMTNGDENLRPSFEFRQNLVVDEGPPQYTPNYT